ncbi:multiple C2 and transmembrane domain-containing protein 1-like isoform X3 [Gigantopelta aegis]|uniref:multiple C2 and transmembrane domain-containing protein 1-like isoform X3 n=1 Tax=Gigantopelta aegis TaxID=1735272 RepID=UPI001B88C587|nr:multiple C2 and transmembrane domain-containing protein 1-like isoform X3 [Gigantopelta aegis]
MSDQSPFRKYISNILHRKTKKKDKLHDVKYEESVSHSMENLLNVASSIPLPSHVASHDDTDDFQSSTEHLFLPAVRDRHSDDQSESEDRREIEEFAASVLRSDISSSSPPTQCRQFSVDSSSSKANRVRQSRMLSLAGRSGSQISDKESDFDDDMIGLRGDRLSLTSARTNSGVFNLSEDDSEYYTVGRRLPAYMYKEPAAQQRLCAYMQHPFFMLDVHLHEGCDLVIRDSCGTSDPYVKFKIGGKQVYRSRTVYKNLNPKWDEAFTVPIEDIYKPVQIKVYDYDRGMYDDPMGSAEIELTALELGNPTEMKLLLSERGKSDYMGFLIITCTLLPKSQEDKDVYFRRSIRPSDSNKKMKIQVWNSVVTIVLVEGNNLVPMDDNGFSDPYVKFQLGKEKYKSKFKPKTLNPKWTEQFDLRMYEDQTSQLEITVFDHDTAGKDDFMGRAVIDLSKLSREITHTIKVDLEDGAGVIKLLLTISGTAGTETITDLANYTPNPREREEILRKYGLLQSFKSLKDIGWLQVKVFKAQGLKAADFGGLSDPFCVLELVNTRLQTQTEYKTLNPDWNKVFTFNVKDVHSILEVTVYDEDRDKKVEFLGRVNIPILRVRNGERRWYALKDKKLLHRSKGAILLEMHVVFNHIKAAIRTVNPREEKYMQPDQKFKISIMKRNIDRVSQIVSAIMETGRFIQSCFNWESTPRSITAFIVFLVAVWNFELYMLPITILIIFLKNLIIAQILGAREPAEDEYFDDDEDDDDEDKDKKKDEKKSFKERLQSIQDVCLTVQQGMDAVASVGERFKNTFNWTVPWLSTLAVVTLAVGAVVLYFIPLRLLVLAWGINKFTKKLRKPNAIPNNELLDFLSRVPSDNELIQYRELRPDFGAMGMTKKKRV